ncbi:conserved hypothetical protein [Escherichia coli TA143]|nr:conserved hypothetical protein [Escherichia coli TA143]
MGKTFSGFLFRFPVLSAIAIRLSTTPHLFRGEL